MSTSAPAISIHDVTTVFGSETVHDRISFSIPEGQIVSVIGASGTGKSTLLREIVGLQEPTSGECRIDGEDIWSLVADDRMKLLKRTGVLFQNGALFSALSCGENIALPMREQSDLKEALIPSLVQLRLALAGLPASTAEKAPSELSGGMRKRVALARALALEPDFLFLDEPTSGLDPISARQFDHLVKVLSKSLNLTIFMVSHDLDSILDVSDRVICLGEGKIIADGPPTEVIHSPHPWIQSYFESRRAV
ncbi:UNVERIFIED_CONTAM: hypothetical protein GTU68_008972 [Idotea baltica]|nr:hypothetical protein [Idotea baltica]